MTIKSIAAKAGVSTATVSYVINNTGSVSEETRKHVLQVLRDNNYKPNRIARSLRVNRTNTIGVIAEDVTVSHVPWIINGINEYAEKHGYHILLNNLRMLERIGNRFDEFPQCRGLIQEEIETMSSTRVDGIIYLAMHDRKIEGLFENVEFPVVYTYCYTGSEKDLSVTYENQDVARGATNYLIGLGHQRIAVISGPINSMPAHKRMLGFQTALMEAGLELRQEYIKTGDWHYDFGYEMCLELLGLPEPPTAIFAMNDVMALGALAAAHERGIRVPDELSVLGFDDIESSRYSFPKLTTISLPLRDMGYAAAEDIDKVIQGRPIEHRSLVLPCKLVVRGSVSKPGR